MTLRRGAHTKNAQPLRPSSLPPRTNNRAGKAPQPAAAPLIIIGKRLNSPGAGKGRLMRGGKGRRGERPGSATGVLPEIAIYNSLEAHELWRKREKIFARNLKGIPTDSILTDFLRLPCLWFLLWLLVISFFFPNQSRLPFPRCLALSTASESFGSLATCLAVLEAATGTTRYWQPPTRLSGREGRGGREGEAFFAVCEGC